MIVPPLNLEGVPYIKLNLDGSEWNGGYYLDGSPRGNPYGLPYSLPFTL